MGFHRRTLSAELIRNYGVESENFISFDRYMTGADAYSFKDEFSSSIWEYYSIEDEDSRRNFWITLSESPRFFDEIHKCYDVINHHGNLPIHSESINRYANLLRIKWGNDPYKTQIINYLHGSAKSNY